MSFSTQWHQNEGILLTTLNEDFNVGQEMPAFMDEARTILDQSNQSQSYIIDFKRSFDMGDIISGTSAVARGSAALFHHPQIKKVLFVTNDKALKLAAAGMKSKIFGGINVEVFENLDDALGFARSN